MRSRWNAKGDTVATVVLWVGSLIAALICVIWLAKNLYPDHLTIQGVDNELTAIQRDLNTACRMERYWKNYYPKINTGTLILNDLEVCIDTSACRVIYYSSNGTDPDYSDGNIIVGGNPCGSVESCSALYYSSDSAPYDGEDYIFISNATSCKDKHPPVVRCRLLTCSLNYSAYVYLSDITLVNITRDENGTFNATAH
jgi:hypothetical protein